jgi:hypothetical protein
MLILAWVALLLLSSLAQVYSFKKPHANRSGNAAASILEALVNVSRHGCLGLDCFIELNVVLHMR